MDTTTHELARGDAGEFGPFAMPMPPIKIVYGDWAQQTRAKGGFSSITC